MCIESIKFKFYVMFLDVFYVKAIVYFNNVISKPHENNMNEDDLMKLKSAFLFNGAKACEMEIEVNKMEDDEEFISRIDR